MQIELSAARLERVLDEKGPMIGYCYAELKPPVEHSTG